MSGERPNASGLFTVHRLNERGLEKAQTIANGFDALVETLQLVCPDGREMSIVKTKLQEACFFAKRAMANDVSNQAVSST